VSGCSCWLGRTCPSCVDDYRARQAAAHPAAPVPAADPPGDGYVVRWMTTHGPGMPIDVAHRVSAPSPEEAAARALASWASLSHNQGRQFGGVTVDGEPYDVAWAGPRLVARHIGYPRKGQPSEPTWERYTHRAKSAYWLQLDPPARDLIEVVPCVLGRPDTPAVVRLEVDGTCPVGDVDVSTRSSLTPDQADAMADVLRAAADAARAIDAERLARAGRSRSPAR
jgi:hypothetical protein